MIMATIQQAIDIISRDYTGKYGISKISISDDEIAVAIDTHKIVCHESTREILEREAFPFKIKIINSDAAITHHEVQTKARKMRMTQLLDKGYEHLPSISGTGALCGCDAFTTEELPKIKMSLHNDHMKMPEQKPELCPDCFSQRSAMEEAYNRTRYRMQYSETQGNALQDDLRHKTPAEHKDAQR